MLQWFNSSFGSSHNLQTSSTQLEKLKGAWKERILQLLNHKPKITSQEDIQQAGKIAKETKWGFLFGFNEKIVSKNNLNFACISISIHPAQLQNKLWKLQTLVHFIVMDSWPF